MCRNKTKNRRGSIEAASPFEEIPLNTVNGTGKKWEFRKENEIPVEDGIVLIYDKLGESIK